MPVAAPDPTGLPGCRVSGTCASQSGPSWEPLGAGETRPPPGVVSVSHCRSLGALRYTAFVASTRFRLSELLLGAAHPLIGQTALRKRRARLLSVAHAPDPGVHEGSAIHAEHGRPGVVMRIAPPSRSSEVAGHTGVLPMPSSWPRPFRPAWRARMGWSPHSPVGHGPTGSSGRHSSPEAGARGMSTAAGPAVVPPLAGASVAPPPILLPVEQAPAATTNSRGHSKRPVNPRHCARLPR